MQFFNFLQTFYIIQWEACILSISHVIQWEFEAWEASGGGRIDGQTYGRLEIHPCVLQDIGALGPLPKKEERTSGKKKERKNRERKKV